MTAAKPIMQPLDQLQQAINTEQEKQQQKILEAKQAVNQALKEVVANIKQNPDDDDMRDANKDAAKSPITEIVHFHGNKKTYIRSDKMKNHWRHYKIDKDIADKSIAGKVKKFKDKITDKSTGKLDHEKLKKAIGHVMGKAPKNIVTVFDNSASWSTQNYDKFAGSVSVAGFKADSNAQLFRATACASDNCDFEPKAGKFSFNAEADANYALAQGMLTSHCYLPDEKGIRLNVCLPKKLPNQSQWVDLGAVRCELHLTANAFVGASVQVGANLNMQLKTVAQNKYISHVVGSNKPDVSKYNTDPKYAAARADAEKNGAKINANAFVGAKAGGKIGAKMSWLNPEKQLLTANTASAISNGVWSTLASFDVGATLALGAGEDLGFSIGYDTASEKLYVRAHAQAVLGAGASGEIGWTVEFHTIEEFFMFIYHKLKNHNFAYIGLFIEGAMDKIVDIYTHLIMDEAEDLKQIAVKGFSMVEVKVKQFLDAVVIPEMKLDKTMQLVANINNPSIASRMHFSPPEVKGRLLYILSDPQLVTLIMQVHEQQATMGGMLTQGSEVWQMQAAQQQIQQVEQAILTILAMIQCQAEYINVVQHMALHPTTVHDQAAGEQRLYNALGIYGRSKLQRLKTFKEMLDNEHHEVIYPNAIAKDTPYQTNHEVLAL